jgi:indolepyruvate ferredoxin oxidoreductase
MGAEGVTWVGQAPFTNEKHVFTNLGDGTYFHSGILAIRAAVAAKVNITYKILFNDAVAMTGGQNFDGPLDPGMISRQIAAEGVTRLSWSPTSRRNIRPITTGRRVSPCATVRTDGCAARAARPAWRVGHDLRPDLRFEKRRRRKRNEYPDPAKRAVINEAVCEGCGDCSVQSNCLSVEPLETELGRKRQINQSSQQGLLLRDRFLPELCDGGRRRAEETEESRHRRSAASGAARRCCLRRPSLTAS